MLVWRKRQVVTGKPGLRDRRTETFAYRVDTHATVWRQSRCSVNWRLLGVIMACKMWPLLTSHEREGLVGGNLENVKPKGAAG